MSAANFEIWIAWSKFLMPIDIVRSLSCLLKYSKSLRGKQFNCSSTVNTSVPRVIAGTFMTLLNNWMRPSSFNNSFLQVVAISKSLQPRGGTVFKRNLIFSNRIFNVVQHDTTQLRFVCIGEYLKYPTNNSILKLNKSADLFKIKKIPPYGCNRLWLFQSKRPY